MTYNAKVYRAQGGNQIVVGAGGSIKFNDQTLTALQSATPVTPGGVSFLQGTTTGPAYSIANPIAGVLKQIVLAPTSSGATHRAVLRTGTTGVSFDSTGGNQITLATSALKGVSLVGASTSAYRIVGVYSGVSLAAPRTT